MTMQPENNGRSLEDLNLTPEERAEITQRLDDWFGIDADTGAIGGSGGVAQASIPPVPASAPSPVAQVPVVPLAPPQPREYQLGDVMVPESDAAMLQRYYAFVRNNPHRAEELERVMTGPPPVPVWQQPQVVMPNPPQQTAPTAPPPQQSWTPPPQQSWTPAPAVHSSPLDLDDPRDRYIFDRMAQLEEQARVREAAYTTWQQQEQQKAADAARIQQQEALRGNVEKNTAAGIARFRAAHPDLGDDQIGDIANRAAKDSLFIGLAQTMPYDQAVARAMEYAHAIGGGALSLPGAAGKPAADVARQTKLTQLSSPAAGSRLEAPAPPPQRRATHRNDAGPLLDDADREQAMKMIEAAGIGSLASQIGQ